MRFSKGCDPPNALNTTVSVNLKCDFRDQCLTYTQLLGGLRIVSDAVLDGTHLEAEEVQCS